MSWLSSLLSDGTNGTISSKRVISLLAFMLCAIEFLCELFFQLDVKPHTLDLMMYIVIAGLGFTASEKFAPTNKEK
jgi:hypothetical protein